MKNLLILSLFLIYSLAHAMDNNNNVKESAEYPEHMKAYYNTKGRTVPSLSDEFQEAFLSNDWFIFMTHFNDRMTKKKERFQSKDFYRLLDKFVKTPASENAALIELMASIRNRLFTRQIQKEEDVRPLFTTLEKAMTRTQKRFENLVRKVAFDYGGQPFDQTSFLGLILIQNVYPVLDILWNTANEEEIKFLISLFSQNHIALTRGDDKFTLIGFTLTHLESQSYFLFWYRFLKKIVQLEQLEIDENFKTSFTNFLNQWKKNFDKETFFKSYDQISHDKKVNFKAWSKIFLDKTK